MNSGMVSRSDPTVESSLNTDIHKENLIRVHLSKFFSSFYESQCCREKNHSREAEQQEMKSFLVARREATERMMMDREG